MRSKILSAVIIVLVLNIVACKKPVSPLAEFVPKDANTVIAVDFKTITDKLATSGITIDSLLNLFSDERDEDALQWADIKNSGIDLDVPFFVFKKQTNSIQGGNTTTSGMVAQIDDANKLIAFLKRQNPEADVTSGTNYQYFTLKDGSVAGWRDKVMVISSVVSDTNVHHDAGLSHQQITTLFSQKESASFASIDEFGELLKKPGDLHFWMRAPANLGPLAMMGMTRMGTLLEDTYTAGTVNFENGKVVASAETHFSEALSDILSKYPSREINKEIISRYPGPVNGFAIVAINPKVLVDILHYMTFDVMSDNFLSQLGFTTADLISAFKGDLAIIYSDFQIGTSTPGSGIRLFGSNRFLLNAEIGDRAAFDRVMTGLVKQGILSKDGNRYRLGSLGGHNFVIESTNENLMIASDEAVLKAYQAPNVKSALSPEVEKLINNKSMAAYVDLAKLLETSRTLHLRDSYYVFPDSNKTWDAARSTFRNFIAFTDKSDGKTGKTTLQLTTVNGSENSLASLAKFLAVTHAEDIRHRNNPTLPPVAADTIPAIPNIPDEDSE